MLLGPVTLLALAFGCVPAFTISSGTGGADASSSASTDAESSSSGSPSATSSSSGKPPATSSSGSSSSTSSSSTSTSCGSACAIGEDCTAGKCSCPNGDTLSCAQSGQIPATCSNKNKGLGNVATCGTCAIECTDREDCDGGACTCRPGLTRCGLTCVDLASDVTNCGACGTDCTKLPATPLCESTKGYGSAGVCTAAPLGIMKTCPTPFTDCGTGMTAGSCVNTTTMTEDPLNCGACGKTCANDELCVAGKCAAYYVQPSCDTCGSSCTCEQPGYSCCTFSAYGTAAICVSGGTCG